ncbi:hypothetical protein, partial [Aureimonas sp. Leaf460]|uniref:hypothetical protein n=1 Tax=Aureimonas sp. Leaf460 TaxID=1736384 RepID=UPI001AEBD40E
AYDTSSQDAGKSVAARSANRKLLSSLNQHHQTAPHTQSPVPKKRGAFVRLNVSQHGENSVRAGKAGSVVEPE